MVPHADRCSCCPYGYHIDVDFVRYSDSLNDGDYLNSLKKIKQQKRELRKSMETYLNRSGSSHSSVPPDVVHSTESFVQAAEREENQTREILDEIDLLMHNGHLTTEQRAVAHNALAKQNGNGHLVSYEHTNGVQNGHSQVVEREVHKREYEGRRIRKRLVEEVEEIEYEIRGKDHVDNMQVSKSTGQDNVRRFVGRVLVNLCF